MVSTVDTVGLVFYQHEDISCHIAEYMYLAHRTGTSCRSYGICEVIVWGAKYPIAAVQSPYNYHMIYDFLGSKARYIHRSPHGHYNATVLMVNLQWPHSYFVVATTTVGVPYSCHEEVSQSPCGHLIEFYLITCMIAIWLLEITSTNLRPQNHMAAVLPQHSIICS